MKPTLVTAVLIALFSVAHAAEEAPIGEVEARDRMQRIADQIRDQREILRLMRGAAAVSPEESRTHGDNPSAPDVVCPPVRWVTGIEKPVTVVIRDLPLWYCARFYAFLTQKEVTVSGSVATASLGIKAEGISRADAITRFEAEFTRLGVMVRPAGESKLALVPKTETNQPVETTSSP